MNHQEIMNWALTCACGWLQDRANVKGTNISMYHDGAGNVSCDNIEIISQANTEDNEDYVIKYACKLVRHIKFIFQYNYKTEYCSFYVYKYGRKIYYFMDKFKEENKMDLIERNKIIYGALKVARQHLIRRGCHNSFELRLDHQQRPVCDHLIVVTNIDEIKLNGEYIILDIRTDLYAYDRFFVRVYPAINMYYLDAWRDGEIIYQQREGTIIKDVYKKLALNSIYGKKNDEKKHSIDATEYDVLKKHIGESPQHYFDYWTAESVKELKAKVTEIYTAAKELDEMFPDKHGDK